MNTNKKKRIELIDIAKAITIFLVIAGHTTGNLETPLYRRILYSFHMPLFFFLAGLSIKAKKVEGKQWLAFLKKNILALLVPYFIWALIYGPFSFENITKILYGSWEMLDETGTLTSLWYLSCFFIAKILTQIATNISLRFSQDKQKYIMGIITILFMIIGFVIPHPEKGLPFGLDIAFVASGFILLGIIFHHHILIFAQEKTSILIISFVLSLLVFFGGTILRGDALDLSLMCRGRYGNILFFLLNSISGSLSVLTLSMIICRLSRESSMPFSVDVITYIGEHTMGIFILHKNLLQMLILPFLNDVLHFSVLPSVLIGSLIALVLSMALCLIIESFVPQLLGQFPIYEHGDNTNTESVINNLPF